MFNNKIKLLDLSNNVKLAIKLDLDVIAVKSEQNT